MSDLDQYRISDKGAPIRLGLGSPTFFMVREDERGICKPVNYRRLLVGHCKRVTLQLHGKQADFTFNGVSDTEREVMTAKLRYLCSTPDSLGLAVERWKGKSALVAILLTQAAADDATDAFDEIDAEEVEERQGYMSRDRDTGEEYLMFDPPGGEFRDLGDEYQKSEETGLRLRDRRDGCWTNGDCVVFKPEGELRAGLLGSCKAAHIIRLPALDRTQIFPDGYEIIEDGSEEGWAVWQWCAANAKNRWQWINLGSDGGPWLELTSSADALALFRAFPAVAGVNDLAVSEALIDVAGAIVKAGSVS